MSDQFLLTKSNLKKERTPIGVVSTCCCCSRRKKSYGRPFRAGVLKLWIFPFLMEFEFLNLEFGNQIWKFMCSYFGKFFG